MAYKAIYRKWRPMVFEDIVGQSHITDTLKNQISEGRVGHAYLFCGTRGTGKTTAAKIFARAVNCMDNKSGSPCNQCEMCTGILDGSIMDVAEIDAASNNGVDNIRELRDDTKYVTASAKYRVYIIDEVHMLSTSAFNALLKTLEEPPEHVIFILATTEPHQVPQTILSRCQRYDFRRITPNDIILRLKEIAYGEGFDITEDAYSLIARLGDGSMRDAISVLERVVSAHGSKITYQNIISTLGIIPIDTEFEMAKALIEGNVEQLFKTLGTITEAGKDLNVFADTLITHFRNLLVCKVVTEPDKLLDYSADEIVRFKSLANSTSYEKLTYISECLTKTKASAKWVKSPRVIYETAFVKICRPELENSYEALSARLKDMEAKLESGQFASAVTVQEAQQEQKPIPEKKEPPAKLYNPIPADKLNGSNPIVIAAKKWDRTVHSITARNAYLSSALVGINITIDNDGIILLYNRERENGAYNIALNRLQLINKLVRQACGVELRVKVAYADELEDCMVDFWALTDSVASADTEPDVETTGDIDGVEQKAEQTTADPLSNVMDKMEGFIDAVDDRAFTTYEPNSEDFSQSEIEDDEDDDREEFLDKSEIDE